jgi:hypothetical protein
VHRAGEVAVEYLPGVLPTADEGPLAFAGVVLYWLVAERDRKSDDAKDRDREADSPVNFRRSGFA